MDGKNVKIIHILVSLAIILNMQFHNLLTIFNIALRMIQSNSQFQYPGRQYILLYYYSTGNDSIQVPDSVSVRPPITGYNVYSNVTSSYTSILTHSTNVTHSLYAGIDSYTVIVNAQNIIGNGDNSSIVGQFTQISHNYSSFHYFLQCICQYLNI